MNRDNSVDDTALISQSTNVHTQQRRQVSKLHERLFTNMRLQRRIKNRRLQSVSNDTNTNVLQKCYSADDNIMISSASTSGLVNDRNHKQNNKNNGNNISFNNQSEVVFEEYTIVPHIHIRAATLEKIMEELLSHLDINSNLQLLVNEENLIFPRIFFLVHQWFSNSQTIGQMLINFSDFNHPDYSIPHSTNKTKTFKVETVTLAFCLWIEFYSNDFMGPDSCMPILTQYMERLQEFQRADLVTTLENCLNASYDWSRGLSLRISVKRHLPSHIKLMTNSACETSSLVFNQIHPSKIAEQLTVIEFKAFRRITIQDLKTYTINGTIRDIPRLERSVYLFNGMSQWVQCMILNKTSPGERAKVLEKFLLVARHLLFLQNFNSFYAIIGGITHSTISRLSNTMALLSTASQKMLDEFSALIASKNNFSTYRQMQKEAKGFHIPVLAVHLKDLIFYNTALSDHYGGKLRLINFRKFAQLASTLQCILDQQSMQINIHQNVDLSNTLRLSLDLQFTEEEIYELSLAREPRSSSDISCTATRNILFAEFVSGVKPPTAEILKQHINGMVEAVFKVYDNDKDGLISSDEFDQVAENFPFIDSFAVLDADNDGVISKQEMKSYFLRANYNALKNSFKHGFFENTYFKPTFCAHCTGLLWGLIKQGWRCRDCGLNVHKHCKDQVVAECRSSRFPLSSMNRYGPCGTGSSPSGGTGSQSSTGSGNNGTDELKSPTNSLTDDNNSFVGSLNDRDENSVAENPRAITIQQKRRMSQRRKHQQNSDVQTQTFDEENNFQKFTFIDEEQNDNNLVNVELTITTCDEDFGSKFEEQTIDVFHEEINKIKMENLKLQNEIYELQMLLLKKDDQISMLLETLRCIKIKLTSFVLDILSIFNPPQ